MIRETADDIELALLLEGLFRAYGYDFREYAPSFLKRRLTAWISENGFATLSHAQGVLLRDPQLFASLLGKVTVNVSEMFRDPEFFRALRECVVPFLKTWPRVKIWHAGCATGEEVYSLAIVLHEEEMAGRYQAYATDIDEGALQQARDGIYHLRRMQEFTRQYHRSGGRRDFADYYTARYERAIVRPFLKDDLLFTSHNLATDGTFGEMNLVLCRNVMIYFSTPLKVRVARLLDAALVPGGFLCVGLKETLQGTGVEAGYETFDETLRIYRKRYGGPPHTEKRGQKPASEDAVHERNPA